MKKQLLIAYFASLSSLALIAQPNCGLWLNEVPLVADTAASTIYATIEPGVGSTFKGNCLRMELKTMQKSLTG